MKRMLAMTMVCMMLSCGTAFAAEKKEVWFWRNKEIILEDTAIWKNGKWMVSLSDLERLTESRAKNNEDFITFQKTVGVKTKDAVSLETARTAFLSPDWTLFEMTGGEYRKTELAEDVFLQDGEVYLPCRTMAEALGYDVRWCKWNGQEMIELNAQEMPEITLDVEYDKKADKLNGIIHNKEPQAFLFGYDFSIERMTENGWERVNEAEPRDINDIGFIMNATRSETGEDGISTIQRRVYTDLPTGQYRMGIPFSYRYHMKNVYGSYMDEVMETGDTSKINWDIYYSTHWGKPDFYFEGDGLSTHDVQKDTDYILYGEFTVE